MFSLLGALLLVGCNENGINDGLPPRDPGVPSIAVVPPALAFGQLTTSEVETRTFTVLNVGDTLVTVNDITFEGVPSYTITGDTSLLLEPDQSIEVEVAFTPTAASNDGLLIVHSDDPDEPTSFVELSGIGSVPELTITPELHDFDEVLVPCAESVVLTLENTGREPLEITSIDHLSDGDFELLDDNVLPLTLPVGDTTEVEVVFVPDTDGASDAELVVESNDPRGDRTAEQIGDGRWAGFANETLAIPTNPPVDILFAIDQSCSMDAISSQLAGELSTFIDQVGVVTDDWQIGVANVDTGCFNNGILRPTTPNYPSLFGQAAVEGDDPGGLQTLSEKLLQLTDLALSKTGTGDCNAGFLRPDAQLHVILVSDEPNRSSLPWSTYMQNYQGHLSDPDLLTVSAIIDESNCSLGGDGYPEIVNATSGLVLDLCGAWASQVAQLGATTVQSVGTLQLTQLAAAETIDVRIDGGPLLTGWTYDEPANAVTFLPPLGEGTSVEIDYAVLDTCE